tara:strand:- start:112 stop:591 length:480 start_codon:yes stop_codon:yes gene_type:complete
MSTLGRWSNEFNRGLRMLGGFGEYAGRSSLSHNVDQLVNLSRDDTLLGYFFNDERGMLWNYEGWKEKTFGSGGDDRGEDRSADPITDATTPTVDDTISLDPGVDQTTAPMFTDVSMTASRQTARSALGSRGYDTGTSLGRSVKDVNKKRYGTALTRNMA